MAHIHEVIDSDKCFTIDPITRLIVNDVGNKKTQLIQNDHNSERFAFQLPRYIEGHDMSLCDKVEVHYINIDQSSNERSVGVYEVTDLALSEDNKSVLLSWLISSNATRYVGVLSFAICFKCMSDDVIEYSWNTAINSSIQITKGMYNSEIIIKDYIDVLEVWKEEFMSSIGLSGGCLRTIDPIGTGSFSMNRVEGSDVGTDSVTLGTGCIASGQSCYAEGFYTIAGNYERLEESTATSVQIDSKNMICLSIPFDKEEFPISVGDSIIIMIGILIDITTHNIDIKFITSVVQSITEPDPSTEIKEYKIYIDENEILNSNTDFETTLVAMILYKNRNQSSGEENPMSNAACHAEGYMTEASGNSSHAEGYSTTASGSSSHAEGNDTVASGNYSHAEGYYTTASGESSHAEGSSTVANGYYSHAEGSDTIANGGRSHAEGIGTVANGYCSHTEGSNTVANSSYSHAEGSNTEASGDSSHAEGSNTEASGESSHAEGYYTKASSQYQHVQGKYNIEDIDDTYVHIVGGGTSDTNRKNIHTLDWKGNAVYSGDVSSKTLSINRKEGSTIGKHSVALGEDCTASGSLSHAEGWSTKAIGDESHAEGNSTEAKGRTSHAEGSMAIAIGGHSHAEGYMTTAISDGSHAEGYKTTASGEYSHVEGYETSTLGEAQHVQGKYNIGNSSYAHIVGGGTSDTDRKNIHTLDWNGNAVYSGDVSSKTLSINRKEGSTIGQNSVALGQDCTASGSFSHAEGNNTTASGEKSHAEGDRTTASGDFGSHAEGCMSTASGSNSHAEGEYTTASSNASHAEGTRTTASGADSHAEGYSTTASGSYSHAEGYYNLSGGYTKFDAALGSETVDSAINYYIDVANLDTTLISTNDEIYTLVEDNTSSEKRICKIIVSSITEYSTTDEVSTVKHKIHFDENELKNQMSGFPNIEIINIYVKNNNNPYSTHAEGKCTTASGDSSHAEGDSTTASGESSHAEGVYTTASGDYGSHAEGEYATASGHVSHAEGYFTTASGDSSHAEGDYATASGEDSHAEGHKTTASGYASHAEGEYTKASGKYSHAEGYHTTARTNSQHVQGKYNIEDATNTYAHIVGGGTSSSDRKNIHTLDWNGNAVYSGDVNATDSDGSTVSLLGTKWKLKGNAENNNTISLPDNYTELKVMTYKTDQEYPIAYTQTILKDMIDVINKDTIHLYCGNTQQYGASWSINKSAKTIQLTNIENTTQVNNCATYLYYR